MIGQGLFLRTRARRPWKIPGHVAYADFSRDMDTLLGVSSHTVLPGGLGCFDEHGIFPSML